MDNIRAWKDPEFRAANGIPESDHPAGLVEIPFEAGTEVGGGATEKASTLGCCGGFWGDTGWLCIPTANGYEDVGCLV